MYLLRDGYASPIEWRSSVPVLREGTACGPNPALPRRGYTAETVRCFMVQVTDGESRTELAEKTRGSAASSLPADPHPLVALSHRIEMRQPVMYGLQVFDASQSKGITI